MTDAICSIDICTAHVHAKGWCKMHYSQARNNGGNPLARSKVPKGVPTAYFQANLMTVVPGCKIWPFMLDRDGYGLLKVGLVNRRVAALACEAWHGPAPEGHTTGHGPCHDRACWHGPHLTWETPQQQADNLRRDGTNPVGTRNPYSVLTDDAVREIRQLHADGMRRGLIAERFSVHHNTIDLVVRQVTWKHVK